MQYNQQLKDIVRNAYEDPKVTAKDYSGLVIDLHKQGENLRTYTWEDNKR